MLRRSFNPRPGSRSPTSPFREGRLRRRTERGAYLSILAVGLLVFIAAGGAAIQIGDAVLARSRLQAAIDLGSIKGASMMLINQPDSAAKAAAEAIAEFNLRLNGESMVTVGGAPSTPPSPAHVNATIVNPQARIRLDGEIRRKVFLPGLAPDLALTARSQGKNAPLNIVVVLDHSYSMHANTVSPNPPISGQPSSGTRWFWAKWAINNYVIPELRSGDQLSIVRFSSGSWPSEPAYNRPTVSVYPAGATFAMSPVINATNRAAIVAAAAEAVNLSPDPIPDNWTNIPDGLLAARAALQTAVAGATRRSIVILVTDGAAALPGGVLTSHQASWTVCENTLPATIPSQSNPNLWYRLLRVLAVRTVNVADQLRQDGAVVHAVSFTSGPMVDQNTSSPFQRFWDEPNQVSGLQIVKPILLARTANHQSWLRAPPAPFHYPPAPQLPQPPQPPGEFPWSFPCTEPSAAMHNRPVGNYVSATAPAALAATFTELLADVRVKLEE